MKQVSFTGIPYLATDLKPSGKFLMEDLHAARGTPAVMKELLNNGFLHPDRLTVTGKTLAENSEQVQSSDNSFNILE